MLFVPPDCVNAARPVVAYERGTGAEGAAAEGIRPVAAGAVAQL